MDLRILGKEPIHPEQPTGSDVRYEPEFELLQAEIDKLSVPSASGELDWKKVSDLASGILSQKSKDLLVASYLAVSQIYVNRIEGLTTGLQVIHDMLDQYWENLFPTKKRLRGRIGAIEWWVEKAEKALGQVEKGMLEEEQLKEIDTILMKIDSILKDQLSEPPSLRPIQRIIEMIPAKSEGKPEIAPSQMEPSSQVAESLLSPTMEDLTSEEDTRKVTKAWIQTARKIAAAVLKTDPTDPKAYRYRRIAAWSPVTTLPPETNGQTQIPSPAPHVQDALNDLRNNGKHEAFLIEAEQRVSQYVFWFDLNQWVAESLTSLGENYEQAHEAVCQETAFFLYRLPGLQDMTFSDGTPFADMETKQWLRRIGFGSYGVSASPISGTEGAPTPGEEDHLVETQAKALRLAKKRKLKEAVHLLREGLNHCLSRKEAYSWRLALSEILIGSKRPDMALPHLDLILKEIETYQLRSWEPELALKGLKIAWTGFRNHANPQTEKKAEAVLHQIAELDPAEALPLTK